MLKKKENDSDDDIYDMLEIYEQCEYILWIVNEKKKQTNKQSKKQKRGDTHTSHKIADKNHSNMDNKK